MKRAILLTALTLTVAVPMFAQTQELGILVGGARRFIDSGTCEPDPTDPSKCVRPFLDNEFSFTDAAIDLYWAMDLEEHTRLKFKVGRIETPVAFEVANPNFDPKKPDETKPEFFRRDVNGEVQHASAVIEYRFDEPYGSTSLFGGLGLYRQSGDDSDFDTQSDYGFQAGVNADFPISRRYGVIVEGTYHWSRGDFGPKYFTLTGGLRIGF